ncbi:glycosyltransferase family 39 protein [Candidatus Uhrbacteria bacterium]|nr:glycosyltransferase family 39 protein [Candidatus Uhrbacteria bacterium]
MKKIIALVFVALAAFLKLRFVPFQISADYYTYLQTADLFAGLPVEQMYGFRILKPLTSYGLLWVSSLTGSYESAFWWIMMVGFVACLPVAYSIGKHFFGKEKSGIVYMLWIMLSYPMLKYGLEMATDSVAWLFYFLSTLFLVLYWIQKKESALWIAMVWITLGFFWKEYVVVSLIALHVLVLLDRKRPLIDSIVLLAKLDALFVIPHAVWQVYVFQTYGYTYFDWYFVQDRPYREWTPYHYGKSLFALLMLGWAFVFVGLKQWKQFGYEKLLLAAVLVFAASFCFIWGWPSSRLFFVLTPPLALVGVYGFERICKKDWQYWFGLIVVLGGHLAWLLMNR